MTSRLQVGLVSSCGRLRGPALVRQILGDCTIGALLTARGVTFGTSPIHFLALVNQVCALGATQIIVQGRYGGAN